jgi:hypothetical protein
MRGLFLSLSHRCLIALVGLLLLSTHLLWAQKTSPPSKIAIQLLDAPAPFARVSEAQTRRHFTYREPPLTLEQNPGLTESQMRLFSHYPDQYRQPINTDAALSPATRTAELWRKKYFISRATSTWLTFVPSYGTVPHETTYSIENLEHLAHNIPWVGPVILRMGQQAKAHPQVTRLLKVIKPRF